jgi:hypothetical protein
MVWKNEMFYRHWFLNFALEYATRRVEATQEWLKFNGIYQHQVYADDVN